MIGKAEGENAAGEPAPVTVKLIFAALPAFTEKVAAPEVGARVKDWLVAVIVKDAVVVRVVPPVPPSVPVIVMVCTPEGTVMLAVVVMVKVIVPVAGVPPKLTRPALLKLQDAPVGRPLQLLGLKLMVSAPFTGVITRVAVVD